MKYTNTISLCLNGMKIKLFNYPSKLNIDQAIKELELNLESGFSAINISRNFILLYIKKLFGELYICKAILFLKLM